MAVLDCRVDQMKRLEERLPKAPTFGVWLSLLSQRHTLRQGLQAEAAEMDRLARGWVFVLPARKT